MGRRQVVRHQVLVLAFGGSNPSGPAKLSLLPAFCRLVIFLSRLYLGCLFDHALTRVLPILYVSALQVFYFSDRSKLLGLRYFDPALKSNTLEKHRLQWCSSEGVEEMRQLIANSEFLLLRHSRLIVHQSRVDF